MYCEVDVFGREQPDRIIIPRSSVHDGKVYKVNSENRLEIKDIEILYHMSQVTVVKSGLKAGDVIVSSDLVPAIEGMLLETVPNKTLEEKIKEVAIGNQGEL
jgi:multidrug efflux pump subunit AcrA (membrane-fusion protein)